MAVSNGNLECAKVLVDFGARLDMVDKSGRTSLHSAVVMGRVECVRFLCRC